MASNKLAKAESKLAAKARAVASKAAQQDLEFGALAGGAAVGLKERLGWDIPSLPGVPDSLAYGVALWLLSQKTSGSMGRSLRGAAVGMGACGVRDIVAGKSGLGGPGGDYVDI